MFFKVGAAVVVLFGMLFSCVACLLQVIFLSFFTLFCSQATQYRLGAEGLGLLRAADKVCLVGDVLHMWQETSCGRWQISVFFVPVSAGPAEQYPTLADIAASRDGASSPLGEDEEADVVLSAFDSFMTQDVAAMQADAVAEQHPSLADIAAAVLESRQSPLEEDEEADVALTAFDHMDYGVESRDKALATQQLPLQSAAGGRSSTEDVTQVEGMPAALVTPKQESDVTAAVTVGYAKSAASPAVPDIATPAAAPSDSKNISGLLPSWWAAILKLFDEWKNALSSK
jgi:hypothetical protein